MNYALNQVLLNYAHELEGDERCEGCGCWECECPPDPMELTPEGMGWEPMDRMELIWDDTEYVAAGGGFDVEGLE